jgi:hypothetical protein
MVKELSVFSLKVFEFYKWRNVVIDCSQNKKSLEYYKYDVWYWAILDYYYCSNRGHYNKQA